MLNSVRFELKLESDDKDLIQKAAALAGTTMASFVRAAAQEKAQALLDQESRILLSRHDFEAITQSLDDAFVANEALQKARHAAGQVSRA